MYSLKIEKLVIIYAPQFHRIFYGLSKDVLIVRIFVIKPDVNKGALAGVKKDKLIK